MVNQLYGLSFLPIYFNFFPWNSSAGDEAIRSHKIMFLIGTENFENFVELFLVDQIDFSSAPKLLKEPFLSKIFCAPHANFFKKRPKQRS